jgi:tetratricopeptide (TPR) repeat protein
MFTIAIISLGLFNAGCAYQPERIDALEKKVDALSHSVESVEPEITELKKELGKQRAEIEAVLSSQSNASNRLEEGLSGTGNLLQEIKQNLALVEEDKNKMKVRLEKLEALSESSAETSLTDNLLNEAIKLYREDKFEEAISKWEEALARDPGKLEAKFNIEIARDRIKEKRIHKELKESLIQRK